MINPFDNEERRAFRDMVRTFVANEVTPYADEWDEAGEIPWALHEKVGALGAFGFGVDEKYGGLGFDDCFMRAAYAEEMAHCGATGVSAALAGRSSPSARSPSLPMTISVIAACAILWRAVKAPASPSPSPAAVPT